MGLQSLRLLQNAPARPQYLASGEDISPEASTAYVRWRVFT